MIKIRCKACGVMESYYEVILDTDCKTPFAPSNGDEYFIYTYKNKRVSWVYCHNCKSTITNEGNIIRYKPVQGVYSMMLIPMEYL